MAMPLSVLQLDPRDGVLIALTDLKAGERVEFKDQVYRLAKNVPAKHKFAVRDLGIGDDVVMYGVLVGRAVKPIAAGELLAIGNIQHQAAPFREQSLEYQWDPPDISRWKGRTFLGYRRSDGQVGTRNYWLVVPLVFCENKNIQVLKQAFEEELGFAAPQIYRRQVAELVRLYREGALSEINSHAADENQVTERPAFENKVFKNIDGVKFLMHQGGCGGTREDSNNLCVLLAGYIHHPNVAG